MIDNTNTEIQVTVSGKSGAGGYALAKLISELLQREGIPCVFTAEYVAKTSPEEFADIGFAETVARVTRAGASPVVIESMMVKRDDEMPLKLSVERPQAPGTGI